jgi:universal stress protein E
VTLAADYDQQKADARRTFERFAAAARVPRERRHVYDTDPKIAIPNAARRLGADVVVMGAVARSAIKRLLIGSTAEQVLNSLRCDVLVVQPPATPSDRSTP